MSKPSFGVLIGRWQPLHDGHKDLITKSLQNCDHLIILIGSSNQCISIKNPFTSNQRINSILSFLGKQRNRVTLLPLNDYRYNDEQWIYDVKVTVDTIVKGESIPTLFGHAKDGNDYLDWFPNWNIRLFDSSLDINGTRIREELFKNRDPIIPSRVHEDWLYYQDEKKKFSEYPYPETLNFNCADVVLTCLGKVLLIERKFTPGKGLFALPGGFKNRDETFLDCAIRELIEETNIRVPEKVLRGSIKCSRMFDSPTRSAGIPRNSMAFWIQIDPDPKGRLPRANGQSDAMNVFWADIPEIINYGKLFDDHADIISTLTGVKALPACFIRPQSR